MLQIVQFVASCSICCILRNLCKLTQIEQIEFVLVFILHKNVRRNDKLLQLWQIATNCTICRKLHNLSQLAEICRLYVHCLYNQYQDKFNLLKLLFHQFCTMLSYCKKKFGYGLQICLYTDCMFIITIRTVMWKRGDWTTNQNELTNSGSQNCV